MKHAPIHKSFGFAFSGLYHAFSQNRNFRLEVYAGIGVIYLGKVLELTHFEMIIVFLMALLVILAEMINTSIEEMTDLITNEHRLEAKIAKDVAAGMVFVACTGAAIVGGVIFYPYIAQILLML